MKDIFFLIQLDKFKRAIEGTINEPNIGIKYKNLNQNIYKNPFLENLTTRPEFYVKI